MPLIGLEDAQRFHASRWQKGEKQRCNNGSSALRFASPARLSFRKQIEDTVEKIRSGRNGVPKSGESVRASTQFGLGNPCYQIWRCFIGRRDCLLPVTTTHYLNYVIGNYTRDVLSR